ncbi:imm68 putative immunity domain-containing protein [Pedobacter caeni]|uniref:Immunity protein 68 n=1 Tax=Pedobacter caeni TaxID=288992 RepID=A0A1M5KS29_9SPHI|nr:imm68 putative immunity domain-containing protein [Pedobacter caeni]SHG54973.1 Immunity protein 68 [Pedobacter caeni]
MYIEKWKDTAFGSDYGGDFQSFLEEISNDKLTLTKVYERCDLKKYFDQPGLLHQGTDNNVKLTNPDFDQFLHYEDAVIALTAVVVESELNGSADLSNAYGSKSLIFDITKEELVTLKNALTDIQDNPDKFILFEMLDEEGRIETLSDISEIIEQLKNCIDKK